MSDASSYRLTSQRLLRHKNLVLLIAIHILFLTQTIGTSSHGGFFILRDLLFFEEDIHTLHAPKVPVHPDLYRAIT